MSRVGGLKFVWRVLLLSILVAAAGGIGELQAQKTDKVRLYRGDVITGEIKGLSHGRLDYSTDDLQTVSIEWAKIAQIESKQLFVIELSNEEEYVGRIEHGDEDGSLVVVGDNQRVYVRMPNVVSITPVEAQFWSRISGKFDVGLDVTQKNDQRILNTSARLSYRDTRWRSSLSGSSYVNAEENEETSTRNVAQFDLQRFFTGSWSALGSFKVEENDELDLEHRYTAVVLGVNSFIRTNQTIFQGGAGLAANEEKFFGEETDAFNVEGVLGLSFEFFKFRDPDINLVTGAITFVGLSDWGRVRPEFNLDLTWEVLSDFNVGIRGYVQGDNRPAEGVPEVDYGLTTTLGYSWD